MATATPSLTPTSTRTPIPTSTFTPSPTPTPDIALLLPEVAEWASAIIIAVDGTWVWIDEDGKPVGAFDPVTGESWQAGEYIIDDGRLLAWEENEEGWWGWFEIETLRDLEIVEVVRDSDGAALAIGEQGLPVARQEVGSKDWQEVNWYQGFTVEEQDENSWVVTQKGIPSQEIGTITREEDDFSVQFTADSIQSFIEYEQVPEWNASQVQVEPETGNLWLMKLSEKTDKYYRIFALNPEKQEIKQILYENPATIFWKDKLGRDKEGIEKGLVNLYMHNECPGGDCSFASIYYNRVFGYLIGEIYQDEVWDTHMQIGMVFDRSEFLIPMDVKVPLGAVKYFPQAVFEPVKEIDPSQIVTLFRDNIEEYLKLGTPLVFQHKYVSYEGWVRFLEEHSAVPNFIRIAQNMATSMNKSCYDVASCIQIAEEYDRNLGLTQEMAEALKAAYEQGKYPDSPLFFFDFPASMSFGIAGDTP